MEGFYPSFGDFPPLAADLRARAGAAFCLAGAALASFLADAFSRRP